ncbi:MAG: membrane protein insertion efficiency factor YidD [FCB group bacterium]|nr:membrane protein insertion efficiency factor YidD [FCB group bacterium]
MALIRLYQRLVSPVLNAVFGPQCRFEPSCSQYAIEAIRKHGAMLGMGYAFWRILRCQPFCRGGYDPVP